MGRRQNRSHSPALLGAMVCALAALQLGGCSGGQPRTSERVEPDNRPQVATSDPVLRPLSGSAAMAERQPGSVSAGSARRATGDKEHVSAIEHTALRERSLQILEQAAFSDVPLLRANAIEALEVVPNRVEPIARSALMDENAGVRFAAAMTIGRLEMYHSAPLVTPLLADPDQRVRAAAIYAMYRTAQEIDPTPLGQMLQARDPRVRAQAAYVIGELNNPSAIPMLRSAAARGPGAELPEERLFRLQIAEAMVKLGDSQARYTIQGALYPSNRDEFEAAVLAAQILGEIRDMESVRQLVNLVETAMSANPTTPASPPANQSSGAGVDPIYLYPPELRLAAATALAKMGYPDGVYVGDSFIRSREPMIRAQAAFLYGAVGGAEHLETMKLLLEDSSPLVQVSAAAAILRVLGADRG